MKKLHPAIISATSFLLLGLMLPTPARSQAVPVEVPELNTQFAGSGVRNVRVGSVSADGTEAVIIMEYTYNGNNGPTALLVPVIESRQQRGVSGWFGADRVAVPRGRGPVSIKVKFFNDEPDVPATLTTDSIRILMLNAAGTAIIGGSTELRTIEWGKEGLQPAKSAGAPAERQVAQLAAEAEDRARERARQAALAEEQARRETAEREAARTKAEAEARAAAEARVQAEAAARLRAEETRQAEARAATEAQAREEARLQAEAETRRLELERQQAEARARAEAEAQEKARLEAQVRQREEARLRAAAEEQRLAEAKRRAEVKAAAEAQAREAARLQAEAETRQLEADRQAAEQRARVEEEARRQAAERATAEASAREEAEAQATEAARIKAEQEAEQVRQVALLTTPEAPAGTTRSRTKITNVEVVNRSLDRSQMTIGIEFDRKDKFDFIGVSVDHTANPAVKNYFVCEPKEIGRQKYALVQVTYAKPIAAASTLITDRLHIYGTSSPAATEQIPLHTATMLLVWRAPGANQPSAASPAPAAPASSVELTDFRQRTSTSGYASVTYQLPEGTGRLRVRLRHSARPESSDWFVAEPVAIKAGQGLELIPVTVSAAASVPAGRLEVDTIEVDLLDTEGQVIGQTKKQTAIIWSREP